MWKGTDLVGTTVDEMTEPQLRHRKAAEFFRTCRNNGYRPKNLLDIGCGNGTVTARLRGVLRLDKVDGVDIQAGTLEVPRWLRLRQVDVDKDSLPYPDGCFDAIYCGELLEHLYNPDNLLSVTPVAREVICVTLPPAPVE